MIANNQNAKLGGVKTQSGKQISKYNASKHSILRETLTEYDSATCKKLIKGIYDFYKPKDIIERILVDRVVVCTVRLQRVRKAEEEYILSVLHPSVIGGFKDINDIIGITEEGYVPKLGKTNVEDLSGVYSRYETMIEYRLFRSMHELERLKRLKKGDNVPPPITTDINNLGSFGNSDL